MSYQVAWFTGSRIIKRGTIYIKPVMHMLKNKMSDCRPDSTKSAINITLNFGHDGHVPFSVVSTVAYYYLNIEYARGEHKQMTERELQIAWKNEIEYAKLQEQKRESQNAKKPQSPDGANNKKDQEKDKEPKEKKDIPQPKESEHAQLQEKKCEAKHAKESQSSDGANKEKERESNEEPRETKDILRKKPAVRDKEYGPALKSNNDPFFELTFKEIK